MALAPLDSEIDPPLVYDPKLEVLATDGMTYRVFVAGHHEGQGIWGGWIEFFPSDPALDPLRTEREATTTSHAALKAWAEGLDKRVVEEAFVRAHAWPPERGADVVHEHVPRVVDADDGTVYRARTIASRRDDGTWVGWLEFEPIDSSRTPLRTGRETTQSNRDAVAYWASGLEPVYLEGALRRARF